MASLFTGPPKPKKMPAPAPLPPDKAEADTQINNARRARGGSYRDTLVGSGLKTSLGQ